MQTVDTLIEVDRNMDEELLEIVGKYEEEYRLHTSQEERQAEREELIKNQQASLTELAESMPRLSIWRRLFSLFFPLVEESTRVRS